MRRGELSENEEWWRKLCAKGERFKRWEGRGGEGGRGRKLWWE